MSLILEGGGYMAEKSARSKEAENELTFEQVKEQLRYWEKKQASLPMMILLKELANFELDSASNG